MCTLDFTADGTLHHICSNNFSYEIKTNPLPYRPVKWKKSEKAAIRFTVFIIAYLITY